MSTERANEPAVGESNVRWNDWKAAASVALLLMSTINPQGFAQQQITAQPVSAQPAQQVNPTAPAAPQAVSNDTTGQPGLPQAPQPKPTEPMYLRDTGKDYSHLKYISIRHPLGPYTSTAFPLPTLSNTPRLDNLLRDGTIYLSLADAVTLTLENNYDLAIARINLDIADTDLLRARSGNSLRGVSTGLVTGTLGGSTSTITGGGGPGGTSSAAGGSGTGASGLVLSTNGGGPQPYSFDPTITGTGEWQRATTAATSVFSPTSYTDTFTENVAYQEGWSSGTLLNVTFDNSRQTTNNPFNSYSPLFNTSFNAQLTQHLLQGFGTGLNRRFIVQAKNDRRITDSAFRQQVLYTINQVENIYWALVSAYEDEQAKERALAQSTQLAQDDRRQLEIGTVAPLEVVNSDSSVATDQQALIQSKSNLEYQQLVMKQAIARNLNDPQLAKAPVVPTDRVGLDRLPEEDLDIEALVRIAYVNNPQVEQDVLTMKNNEITIRGEKNGLLPTVDLFGFYGGSGVGGSPVPCNTTTEAFGCNPAAPLAAAHGYGTALGHALGNDAPNYGVGVNVTINLRNRSAQADQARSQMEYRQSELRLQQIYTQIRIQVINEQYALTNDRSAVTAAQAAREYQAQSLDAEQKKYGLGASTTANVLQQKRNLATAEDNLISATAAYAKDRASLEQLLASTLDRYGISLADAASGTVTQRPNIPGLTAPKAPEAPKPLTDTPPAPVPVVP